MKSSDKRACIILARGGSKGIPHKNIVDFCGKPLLSWTIRAAIESGVFDRVIVSTDSEDIKRVALETGAEVPFIRGENLAQDNVLSAIALKDAVLKCEKIYNEKYEIICELQATSPLRNSDDVKEAHELFLRNSHADSLYSVYELNHFHPKKIKKINDLGMVEDICDHFSEGKIGRRQDAEPLYLRNGAIFIMRREVLIDMKERVGNKCLAFVMPEDRSLNIDTHLDLELGRIVKNV
jgi:CMP-N-acetylneuraminic acid synthetase